VTRPHAKDKRNVARPRSTPSKRGASEQNAGVAAHRWTVAICILLTVVSFSVYSPVAWHPFTNYDDQDYVTNNQHVRSGLSWHTVGWAFTATEQSNWHPLTWLSHALDCQLYGLRAGGHHVTSVLWHALNAILLFLLLARVTGSTARSAMVAALFAVHPLNVESVAWIAERKNVLSMFFFLLALGAYGWYARRPDWKRYAGVALLFALALASKPMVITLPLVLLLLDYWPLGRVQGWTKPSAVFPVPQTTWVRLLAEKVPLLGLSVASAIITLVAQQSGHTVAKLGALPFTYRAQNALYSYAMYVVKTFWPVHLAVLYPHPLDNLTFAQVALSTFFLIAVSAFVWWERTKRPYLATGWLWFLSTLVPMIGLIQVGAQGMADRYMYLPAIGLFLMLVWRVSDWAEERRLNVRTTAAVALTILAALCVLTFRQVGYWRSSYDLWTHTLAVTQDNFMANDNVANLLMEQGRPEAVRYYQAAADLAPWDPLSHGVLASVLQDRGDFQAAIRDYDVVINSGVDAKVQAHAYASLGVIYRELGDHARAQEASGRALSLDASSVRQSIQQLSKLVNARPAASSFLQLGFLQEGAGQIPEARSSYEQALHLDPGFTPAQRALEALGQGKQ
jgi:protein O-mannosyl-transferase